MGNYFKDNYFAKRELGTDSVTGLIRQIRVVGLMADAIRKEVTITWQLVLITTEDAVMEIVKSGSYCRNEDKYDDLQASSVGLGITSMIENMDLVLITNDETLSNFPQCLDQGYVAP